MAEEELQQKNIEPKINEPTVEFKNIPGFDVLDEMPEEGKMKSYNDEFYNTLSGLKFLSVTIPPDDKLFYHFEENKNASITSTTGQIFVTINEIKEENNSLAKIISEVQEKVNDLKKQAEDITPDSIDNVREEIKNLESKLQLFIVDTKTETFKLIKEVASLKKEKNELSNQLKLSFERVEKLEKALGKNKKKLNKLNMNVNKQNVNNDKTFMETKSFNNTIGTNNEKVNTENSI